MEDVFKFDDFPLDPDPFADEPPLSPKELFDQVYPNGIEQCINSALDDLDEFNLSDRAEQIIGEFLTFHWQTRFIRDDLEEPKATGYNLLIRCDDNQRVVEFVDILCRHLMIPNTKVHDRTEGEIIENLSTKTRTSNRPRLCTADKQMVFIHNCKEPPIIRPDEPTNARRDANMKEVDNYREAWITIREFMRSHSQMPLIVSASSDVYHGTLRQNTDLFFRLCGHHIFLQPKTMEDLYLDCIRILDDSVFTTCCGFESALKKYFYTVYPRAELKNRAFVEDLISRIYSLYFSKPRDDKFLLTLDCIPRYHMNARTPEDVMSELNELIGLEAVKREFQNIYKMRLMKLDGSAKPRYHMLFTGNPGTGKTTVAQMAADLLFGMNVIKTNKLVTAKPSDLISEYVGTTGSKTLEVIKRAYDGVLFIDEAYGLANTERGRGAEAINVLIQEMENHSDKLVVIFAGYQHQMHELLKTNPGIASRIGREIVFEDYSLEQLVEIFHHLCRKEGFVLDPSATSNLEDCISSRMNQEFFGNAREMGTLLQSLKEAWSEEHFVNDPRPEDKPPERVFLPSHFERIMPPRQRTGLQDLVGLETLKQKLEAFKKQVAYQKHIRSMGIPGFSDFNMHMIFTGNPGTGKTTVARMIADDLYSIGVLKSNRLVVAERKDLVASIIGGTAQKTQEVIRKAIGGVLFIDEAYSLAGNSEKDFGKEAIEVMITAMEEHKRDTIFIFAGYNDEMQDFLAMNPGIQSRIGYTFHFDDYSPDELTQMFSDKMEKSGFLVSADALARVKELMEYFAGTKNFGNGRFVGHVIQQTVSQRANRDFTTEYRDILPEDIPSIRALIETAPNSMQLYDPAEITDEDHRRTALHELGHAIVMCDSVPAQTPESISIKNSAGSYGRVKLSQRAGNLTEQELMNTLAALLGGKNAERVFLGTHSTGCASDYHRAKTLAQNMIDLYAMGAPGGKATDLLAEAERLSVDIISRNREFVLKMCDVLLEKKEMSGEDFMAAFQSYENRENEE